MTTSLKPIDRQIIVITGASSGIGLATAKLAAERGARLVLTSRNGEVLAAVCDGIGRAGGKAIAVVADVGDRAQLQKVADAALENFGGFDSWVNNAGVGIWGRLDQSTDADNERLFRTNFWGVVNGSLIALEHLKTTGGALINVGSLLSDLALPLQGMYSASKHAVKGFTDALRTELEDEGAPVSVTLIKPSAIDTPFPRHARNYTGRIPVLPPPVYAAEEVAATILHAAAHGGRDYYVGGAGKAISTLSRHAPSRALDFVLRAAIAQQTREGRPERTEGTLFTAGSDGDTSGDHPGFVNKTSAYTRATMNPLMSGAILAGTGLAIAAALFRRGRP